jgi:DNA transformation protein
VAVSAATREFALELFEGLGAVTARPMMGGLALYQGGRIFAIVSGEGRIHLKATGSFAEALAGAGAEQFSYARKDGVVARMGYWSLPEAALDEPEAACGWAQRALDADDTR